MEASVKIELPTQSTDKNDNEYVKNVLYDQQFLKTKNVKDWQEKGGKDSKDKCAIFSGEPTDRHIVICMSKDALVEKLCGLGVWELSK